MKALKEEISQISVTVKDTETASKFENGILRHSFGREIICSALLLPPQKKPCLLSLHRRDIIREFTPRREHEIAAKKLLFESDKRKKMPQSANVKKCPLRSVLGGNFWGRF